MKPVFALVGRTNVGKSTLFNRLTKTRDAIVADYAGLTRDRHYGNAMHRKNEFIIIDTGGFESDQESSIYKAMAKQTQQAIAECDVVLFIVDARGSLTAQDYEIAKYIRKQGKQCYLVINKSEGLTSEILKSDFFQLGMGDAFVISAAHGHGVATMLENIFSNLNLNSDFCTSLAAFDEKAIKIAVLGRPNVGKSTLINSWLGEERLIAFDMPGTTRDAIAVSLEKNGEKFTLIDTAGLRKKGKVFEAVEKFSIIKTLQAVDSCDVVLLLLDATQGITDQDAHIAGYVLESGRALVVAINKWEAIDDYQKNLLKREFEIRLSFLSFAKLHFISAEKNIGLNVIWNSLKNAYKAAFSKMSTPLLTRLLIEAVQFQMPQKIGNSRPKLRYAHQGGMNPPVIIVHGNSLQHVTKSYKRFLETRFRKEFNLEGTPLRIEMKNSINPYSAT